MCHPNVTAFILLVFTKINIVTINPTLIDQFKQIQLALSTVQLSKCYKRSANYHFLNHSAATDAVSGLIIDISDYLEGQRKNGRTLARHIHPSFLRQASKG